MKLFNQRAPNRAISNRLMFVSILTQTTENISVVSQIRSYELTTCIWSTTTSLLFSPSVYRFIA